METALYFPYIRVPETSWFTQILLYWDRAATIVPSSIMDMDENRLFSPYMTELRKAQMLEFVSPSQGLWEHEDAFNENFIELIRSSPLQLTSSERPPEYTPLHVDKMSYSLFRELAGMGYANREGWPWWSVEENIANLYMAYLACAMSGARTDTFPVSDKASSIAALTPSAADVMTRLRELKYVTIMSALPAPSSPPPVKELRKFKDKHQDELQRLRHHIDGRLADLAAIDDEALREVKANSVLAEVHDDITALREQMNKKRWPRVVTLGLGGVVGSSLAATSGIVGAGAGGTLALGLAIAGGATSLVGSMYQAMEIFREPRFNKQAPLVYAALAADL